MTHVWKQDGVTDRVQTTDSAVMRMMRRRPGASMAGYGTMGNGATVEIWTVASADTPNTVQAIERLNITVLKCLKQPV